MSMYEWEYAISPVPAMFAGVRVFLQDGGQSQEAEFLQQVELGSRLPVDF